MNKKCALRKMLLWSCVSMLCSCGASADDGYDLWLKYQPLESAADREACRQAFSTIVLPGDSATCGIIEAEWRKALAGLCGAEASAVKSLPSGPALIIATPSALPKGIPAMDTDVLAAQGDEGYLIRSLSIDEVSHTLVTANSDVGLLYGSYDLLRRVQMGQALTELDVTSKPRIRHRLLNHWDNLDRSIERGYAGRSLWKWSELPDVVDSRYHDYARANASLGLNGTVVHSVNSDPRILTAEYIAKIKTLADVFRPYGLRLFLAVRFSSPLRPAANARSRRGGMGNLDTADPLDPAVQQWWKDKTGEVYQAIPDFGGYLVKANSEGMPGPQDYQRTHAEGANMLADAVAPHGGIVMWRAFVYDADVDPDRAKRAYLEFTALRAKFRPNVFVQPKNGPIDFQPREPVHPLFGAMPRTPLMLELQVTQEYLGHAKHLVYLAPMWKECLDFDTHAQGPGSSVARVLDGSLHDYGMTGIAGVANTGSDRNWCGHLFAQANWYAFGRLAWDHTLGADAIAEEWVRQTLSTEAPVVTTIQRMMMGSWEACIDYMTPLGLHHIMQAGFHYGPQPSYSRSQREDWTSVYYHRADSKGVGFERSAQGSGAALQYFPPVAQRFDSIDECPEDYLLWFHHVGWNDRLNSGQTLWEELCHRYYRGVRYVTEMRRTWDGLEDRIDPEIYRHVRDKLGTQERDAANWRDTCLKYFQRFSELPIAVLAN